MGRQRRQRRKNKISPPAVLPTTFSHKQAQKESTSTHYFYHQTVSGFATTTTTVKSGSVLLPHPKLSLSPKLSLVVETYCTVCSFATKLTISISITRRPITAFGCCFVEPIKRRGNSSSKKSCWLGCERAEQKDRQRTLRGFWCFCAFLDEGDDDEDEDEDEGGDQVLKEWFFASAFFVAGFQKVSLTKKLFQLLISNYSFLNYITP